MRCERIESILWHFGIWVCVFSGLGRKTPTGANFFALGGFRPIESLPKATLQARNDISKATRLQAAFDRAQRQIDTYQSAILGRRVHVLARSSFVENGHG